MYVIFLVYIFMYYLLLLFVSIFLFFFVFIVGFCFFFFKQKTAYGMRISDWSSDVCSSDLLGDREGEPRRAIGDAGQPRRALLGRAVARQHRNGDRQQHDRQQRAALGGKLLEHQAHGFDPEPRAAIFGRDERADQPRRGQFLPEIVDPVARSRAIGGSPPAKTGSATGKGRGGQSGEKSGRAGV